MATAVNPLFNVYRAQVAGMRQIIDATLIGIDRLERLSMRTLREAADDQFQLAEAVSRSLGDSEGRDLATLHAEFTEPAAQRLARCQRDLWVALTEMNGAVAKACGGLAQELTSALAESTAASGTLRLAARGVSDDAPGNSPWAWYEGALKQWQAIGQTMGQPLAGAQSSGSAPTARHAAKRKAHA